MMGGAAMARQGIDRAAIAEAAYALAEERGRSREVAAAEGAPGAVGKDLRMADRSWFERPLPIEGRAARYCWSG